MMSASDAVYLLRLPIVVVTNFRPKTLTPEILDALRDAFAEIQADWRSWMSEFGEEAHHVHLLAGIHPALNLSILINHLESASAHPLRNQFADHLRNYGKPCFWHRMDDGGSIGMASLETVKRYVEAQETKEKSRKAARMPPPVAQNPRMSQAGPFHNPSDPPWSDAT